MLKESAIPELMLLKKFNDVILSNRILLSIITSIFIYLFCNLSLWIKLFEIVDIDKLHNKVLILFLFVQLILINSLFLIIFDVGGRGKFFKFFIIINLLVASVVNYFTYSYGAIIHPMMIVNVMQTDYNEVVELITNFKLVLYVLILGVIPSICIYNIKLNTYATIIRNIRTKLMFLMIVLCFTGMNLYIFYKDLAVTIRNNNELRYMITPIYQFYSMVRYFEDKIEAYIAKDREIIKLSGNELDAGLNNNLNISFNNKLYNNKPLLVIFVVGEAAREANFSIYGKYDKITNPILQKPEFLNNLVYFYNTYSCGTATAESVPCIFSHLSRDKYTISEAAKYENLLDILKNNGVNVLWRENNSACMGVCNRVPTHNMVNGYMVDSSGIKIDVDVDDFKSRNKDICTDEECYDEIMLFMLQKYIDTYKNQEVNYQNQDENNANVNGKNINNQNQNAFVVLHQKGSHGAAYYKRYPKKFDYFKPTCNSNIIQSCIKEDLKNTYDNTILYTDYFLSQVIELLKENNKYYNTMMIYISDHGESLGESGIYLHGLPYIIAPDEQKHIPFIVWMSDDMGKDANLNIKCMKGDDVMKNSKYSHDNIFHSVLGLFKIKNKIYDENLDVFGKCKVGHL